MNRRFFRLITFCHIHSFIFVISVLLYSFTRSLARTSIHSLWYISLEMWERQQLYMISLCLFISPLSLFSISFCAPKLRVHFFSSIFRSLSCSCVVFFSHHINCYILHQFVCSKAAYSFFHTLVCCWSRFYRNVWNAFQIIRILNNNSWNRLQARNANELEWIDRKMIILIWCDSENDSTLFILEKLALGETTDNVDKQVLVWVISLRVSVSCQFFRYSYSLNLWCQQLYQCHFP